jgi:hypothetical protein
MATLLQAQGSLSLLIGSSTDSIAMSCPVTARVPPLLVGDTT